MRRTAIVIVALMAGAAGCSSAEKAPEIATLRSPAAAASSTAGAAPVAPVIRPDSTFAEIARMQQPWMRCLKANGVPMRTTDDGLLDIDATGRTKETNGRSIATSDPKVVAACGKLMPVPAPELDEARNPYWADDYENYNKCLVAHGDPLVKKNGQWVPGPGWGDYAPDEAMEIGCQAKAFDGKKG
jgi:hypothetical protein